MKDTVKNFAIDWQDWASYENLSMEETSKWKKIISEISEMVDQSKNLSTELKENGII